MEMYDFPDVEAQYPGGSSQMLRFILANLEYPQEIQIEEITNTNVRVEFIVLNSGAIKNIKILRGTNSKFDENVINMIQKMPNWIPAEMDGIKICSRIRIPINIELF